jgi:hypothetical protein
VASPPRRCQAVPNSTELPRTKTNIGRASTKRIRLLGSAECWGVRSWNHLLISRLKARFLHGSPFDWGGAPPPPGLFVTMETSGRLRIQRGSPRWILAAFALGDTEKASTNHTRVGTV